jgi:hypothetical protein
VPVTRTQDVLGAGGVGDDRLEWFGHDVANPDRSSQVVDEVSSANLRFDEICIQDVTFDEGDLARYWGEVGEVARRQVVEDRDPMTIVDECGGEMGTDESCSASDEDVHCKSFMCIFRLVVVLVCQIGKSPMTRLVLWDQRGFT